MQTEISFWFFNERTTKKYQGQNGSRLLSINPNFQKLKCWIKGGWNNFLLLNHKYDCFRFFCSHNIIRLEMEQLRRKKNFDDDDVARKIL